MKIWIGLFALLLLAAAAIWLPLFL